jgi:hypothetical protein
VRRVATVPDGLGGVRRCVLHADDSGVFVYLRRGSSDGPAEVENWFPDLASAEVHCRENLGVNPGDWAEVGDPLPHCQSDWLAPVRVKGRPEGRPAWGTFERLDSDGIWREVRAVAPDEEAG